MPAPNVLFRNKVVEANQFSLAALALLTFRFCGGRIFLVLRCIHLASTLISAFVPSSQLKGKNWGIGTTFMFEPEILIKEMISPYR